MPGLDAHVTIGDVGVVVSDYLQARPAPALRPFVAAYSGYRDAGGPPARHVGLPSPYLTFIVTLDDDLEMLDAGGRSTFANLVSGLDVSPVTIVHDGRQSGIQLSLHPLGARALFGCPTAVLGPASHLASAVAPGWVDELHNVRTDVEHVVGGTNGDLINARSAADDLVEGGPGDDTLVGNGGTDHLDGGPGDDDLFGGDGNDLLTGRRRRRPAQRPGRLRPPRRRRR